MLPDSPLLGVATTVIAYAIGLAVQRRWRWMPAMVLTCGLIMLLLWLAQIPYGSYKLGGDYIAFLLGPATVALAVPLYRHADRIRAHTVAIFTAIALGALAGIVSVVAIAAAVKLSWLLTVSMIPKSATTPISIGLSAMLGGSHEMTAVFTALAGLVGSLVGPPLLRRCGVRDDLAIGAAIGTSSHGLGTARLVPESELQTAVSALSMALCGIFTSLLCVLLKFSGYI